MKGNNTLKSILELLNNSLIPLRQGINNQETLSQYMIQFGIDANRLSPEYISLGKKIDTFSKNCNDLVVNPDFETVYQFLNTFSEIFNDIKSLPSPNNNVSLPNDFFKELVDKLIITEFQHSSPKLFSILKLLNVFQFEYVISPSNKNYGYYKNKIIWANFGKMISNPLELLKQSTTWGNTFQMDQMIYLLFGFLGARSITSNISYLDSETKLDYLPSTFSDEPIYALNVDLINLPFTGEKIAFRIFQYALNPALKHKAGVILSFNFPSSLSHSFPISDTITFFTNLEALLGLDFGVILELDNLKLVIPNQENVSKNVTGLFGLKYDLKIPILLLGRRDSTRLVLDQLTTNFSFISNNDDLEIIFEIDLSELVLIINPGESDNFIKTIFGKNPRQIRFPIAIRWSSKNGISFVGSGSFEFNVNMHLKIGPIEFTDVKIALRAPQGQDKVVTNIGTNVKGDLGPIVFTIDDIGLRVTLNLKEDNAGPFGINIGFKPPTGIGLSIDAPPVKGGGFLNYDESTSTYTGGLELNFSKISFTAIGILTTKLPGGDSGYSLLIIISAEFTPLNIGMGFTISGVGGLLGLNRTSNPDVLCSGIRYNTLDHILFPKDIVKNSNAIISNMGQAFPVLKDQFVVGPMVKIHWGTPSLITLELGIIIELPDPLRLIILGILKAQLPSADNAILKIQVNFVGIIDFKEKYLSFDATLYDSKILSFGLFGDMALRLNWGSRPNFLLSVGGFHPAYTPPPLNLPSMQRLTIVLADSKNLKISVETYFAVTSNSAQFGASVYAMARAGKFQAIGALWFDVLFQFSPFYFNANMGVKFVIKAGNKTILGIYIELSLEGPEPWRAKGTGSFKILFVRIRVRFDATFGRQRVEVIDAVAIDSKIKEALKLSDNWEFILPERNNQMASWRKESPSEELSVDPAGAIKISQRLMPLNTLLKKFGSSNISDFNRYSITRVSIDSSNLPIKKVQDYFARNEFTFMKDEEKLSRDGYELFDSGVLVGSEDNITSNYVVHKACGYENITLDAGRRRHLLAKFMLTAQRLHIESTFGYIGKSQLSTSRLITTSVGPNKINLSTLQGEFVLANRNNLKQVVPSMSFANSMQAEQYLDQQRMQSPDSTTDWIIANRYELV